MPRVPLDKLSAFLSPDRLRRRPEERPRAGLPTPGQVLYAHPNPDGSRKGCGNCYMWVRSEQCEIHAANLRVTEDMVCGYHVYGVPHTERSDHGIDPVDPDISGLALVPDGASCDTCRWFEQRAAGGLCNAVADPALGEPPVPVEAKGCCARWDGGE